MVGRWGGVDCVEERASGCGVLSVGCFKKVRVVIGRVDDKKRVGHDNKLSAPLHCGTCKLCGHAGVVYQKQII